MELLGTKIQTLRRNKNMTQSQLAKVLSVSAQSVSKWENHQTAPDISLLPVIARFFGITMDELFNYRLDALNYKERFIRFMVDNGVLQFGSFRLQSGRISPYYIDTGNYRSASQISKLGDFYAECMREHNIETSLLVGNTHREIPIVMATSIALFRQYGLDIQYCLNGSAGKSIEPQDKVTLIKDTLTSGNTLRRNLQAIEACAGKCVSDVIISVDRMEQSEASPWSACRELTRDYGIRIHSVVTMVDIIDALENGIIGGIEYLDEMRRYAAEYGGV